MDYLDVFGYFLFLFFIILSLFSKDDLKEIKNLVWSILILVAMVCDEILINIGG